MSKLDRTRDQVNTILNNVWNGQYATAANLTTIQTKADQNETDIAANQTDIVTNQTDIVANGDKLATLSGEAGSVSHSTDGTLTLDLSTARQYPVVMTANVTQLDLSNGVLGQSYVAKIAIDDAVRTFAFAPDLDESDGIGIYNAGDKVTHPNGRIYKVAAGQSGLKGADFQVDLDAADWLLHIRTQNDDGYYPSQADEDILRIECIGTDYYKITPHYGS
ncbi:MAG: hypothetical protein HEP71_00615 [Roseivirga sp.]|nr:hypothetical protein [Roseivirga sp.]